MEATHDEQLEDIKKKVNWANFYLITGFLGPVAFPLSLINMARMKKVIKTIELEGIGQDYYEKAEQTYKISKILAIVWGIATLGICIALASVWALTA